MTIRREILTALKERLKTIETLEYIDLQKGQYENAKNPYGTIFTCALLTIPVINWQSMTNQMQEGKTAIIVDLYIKDGFMNQHDKTLDADAGFYEIDLLDTVIEKLQFLHFESPLGFGALKPLELINESHQPIPHFGIMNFRLEFQTMVYRKLPQKYVFK